MKKEILEKIGRFIKTNAFLVFMGILGKMILFSEAQWDKFAESNGGFLGNVWQLLACWFLGLIIISVAFFINGIREWVFEGKLPSDKHRGGEPDQP